jgi:radical SAM superfamily enzyme YgiQ (UPF0313 family)
MPDIVLTTLNAKFIHTAFGLRGLFANLGELQSRATIAEFDINQRPLDIAEALLARLARRPPGRPGLAGNEENAGPEAGAPPTQIIGFGIYIWNVGPATEVVALIRRVRPDIKIILGGPEVSHETDGQKIVALADHVITGEADLKFADVCRELLNHETPPTPSLSPSDGERVAKPGEGTRLPKIIAAEPPDLAQLALPYDFYTDADLAHRIVYVEASRGCPFTCEFCLSSLGVPVRSVPLEKFLVAMQRLMDRGLKQFKFVDRTFNLNIAASRAILEFFLARYQPGMFFHFELVPDRLPEALREVIVKFPPGALQFEVGVQTFNPQVGQNIRRRQNYEQLADNLNFLRHRTNVHLHADLIIGLPGETLESFAAGFDRLIALGPQEIQVGILKRLRGTTMDRHNADWRMVYDPQPAYEILQNRLIDFATMQRLRRLAKYWDLIGNSGNFIATTPLILGKARADQTANSPFANFLRLSDWLYAKLNRTDSIALARLLELLFEFLTRERALDARATAEILWQDWQRGGRRDVPEFLREFLPAKTTAPAHAPKTSLPKRQARRLAA